MTSLTTMAALNQSLRRIESLITRPAESVVDPDERQAEFDKRLERTHHLMHYLGDPHKKLDIIHIGGTSGKGSVSMLCEAVLLAAGLRVGTHTSPYLQTPLEKVRLNGRIIGPEDALNLVDVVMEAVNQVQQHYPELGNPHYAEAWLGLALRHFADQGCDAAIIEVGMGGRFDSTNVITPQVSVISTVHYDHTLVLGEELEAIAYHKAGIIKPEVPVVSGEMAEEAFRVVEAEAAQKNARLIGIGRDVHYETLTLSDYSGRFTYRGVGMNLENAEIGLIGGHQVSNAAVGLAALEAFADQCGLTLDQQKVREAMQSVRFAGRLEVMQHEPLVVLDGAHNEEKMGALVASIPTLLEHNRVIIVLGMLDTKQVTPIMETLVPVADVVITTAPHVKGKPALTADQLAEAAREVGIKDARSDGEPLEALKLALDLAEPGDLVVVTGSLYLLGTIREYWYPTDQIIEQRTMFPSARPGESTQ